MGFIFSILAGLIYMLPFLIHYFKPTWWFAGNLCAASILSSVCGLVFGNFIACCLVPLAFVPGIGAAIRKCLFLPKSALIWAGIVFVAGLVSDFTEALDGDLFESITNMF